MDWQLVPKEPTPEMEQSAAAPEPPQQMNWQPIKTAPQNMTEPVVVRWVNGEGAEMRQFDYMEDGCWMEWADHAEYVKMIGGHGVHETPPYEHWVHLPAPPKDAP